MTPEVVELLRRLHGSLGQFPRVALLSPGKAECALFPRARVLRREDWDLGTARRDLRFDLIIACHVFHYASDPARWFANVTGSCRALLITDLIRRKRSADAELGLDGDAMRYAIDQHRPVLPGYFDLRSLGDRLQAHHVFDGAANEYGPALHVLALIRGQLTAPLVHLAGYPGSAHSRAVHACLDEFEARGAGAWLGVAPALLQPDMIAYLRRLRFVTPALHEHATQSRRRLTFFSALSAGHKIRVQQALRVSQAQLQDALGRAVSTYVAPSGRLARSTAQALAELGFDLCLSDRQTQTQVPSVRSDYVGAAAAYPRDRAAEVVGLNLAQEAQRGAGLETMFAALDAQGQLARERVQGLAAQIGALGVG